MRPARDETELNLCVYNKIIITRRRGGQHSGTGCAHPHVQRVIHTRTTQGYSTIRHYCIGALAMKSDAFWYLAPCTAEPARLITFSDHCNRTELHPCVHGAPNTRHVWGPGIEPPHKHGKVCQTPAPTPCMPETSNLFPRTQNQVTRTDTVANLLGVLRTSPTFGPQTAAFHETECILTRVLHLTSSLRLSSGIT